MKKGKGIIMPEAIERLDDRTFFVLYALSKGYPLMVDYIYRLYPGKTIDKIFEEFDDFAPELCIKIVFSYQRNLYLSEEIIEKLEAREKNLESLIPTDFWTRLKEISMLDLKLLPYVLRCEFCCPDNEKVKMWLDDYLIRSVASRKKYYSSYERHHAVFKKVCEWARKEMCSPPFKVGLNRFLERVEDEDKSKCAFFHFLYELEQNGEIQIAELAFRDNYYPFIIFTPLTKIGRKPRPKQIEPRGEEISHYTTLHLYENGLFNSAAPDNFVKCEDLEVDLLKGFFKQPKREHSYAEVAALLHTKDTKLAQKKISNVRRKLKAVSGENGGYNIEKVKGKKAYILKFTEK